QDLHDDLGAVDEPRRMHLGDRRGGERLALEMREYLGDRTVERTLEQRERDVRRERRHLVLELRELVRELGRQQVAARRHGLAELHVDRPELLEREPEPLPERPRLDRRPGQELLQPRERPEQVGVPDDLVEPVAEQRPLDAQESERQPQAAERHQVVSTSARAHETRVRARRISMRASIRSTSSRSRSIASRSASASGRVGNGRLSSVRYSAVSAVSASKARAAHRPAARAALPAPCAATSPTQRDSSSSGSGSARRRSAAKRSTTCTRPVTVTPEPGSRLARPDASTRIRSSGVPRTVASAASASSRTTRMRPPSTRSTTSSPRPSTRIRSVAPSSSAARCAALDDSRTPRSSTRSIRSKSPKLMTAGRYSRKPTWSATMPVDRLCQRHRSKPRRSIIRSSVC